MLAGYYIENRSGVVMNREDYLACKGRDDPFPALAHRDEVPEEVVKEDEKK